MKWLVIFPELETEPPILSFFETGSLSLRPQIHRLTVAGWPVSPTSSCLRLTLGSQEPVATLGFSHECRGLNLGPQACAAGTFPTSYLPGSGVPLLIHGLTRSWWVSVHCCICLCWCLAFCLWPAEAWLVLELVEAHSWWASGGQITQAQPIAPLFWMCSDLYSQPLLSVALILRYHSPGTMTMGYHFPHFWKFSQTKATTSGSTSFHDNHLSCLPSAFTTLSSSSLSILPPDSMAGVPSVPGDSTVLPAPQNIFLHCRALCEPALSFIILLLSTQDKGLGHSLESPLTWF